MSQSHFRGEFRGEMKSCSNQMVCLLSSSKKEAKVACGKLVNTGLPMIRKTGLGIFKKDSGAKLAAVSSVLYNCILQVVLNGLLS